mmetsp:Transcript_16182/g.41883  ORF Transcript_16182/g.41883 Transcript_16182/m.41883 type:complete len:133 (+) Transcript_16182:972-1370(+)
MQRASSFLAACAEDDVEVLKVARRVQILPVEELAVAWAAAAKQPAPQPRIENICWRSWSSRCAPQVRAVRRHLHRSRDDEAIPPIAAILSAFVWIALLLSVGHLVTSSTLFPGSSDNDFAAMSNDEDMDDGS